MKPSIKKISFLLLFVGYAVVALCQNTLRPAQYFNPKWSPDGKSIVFESTKDGKSSIYTISSDGSNLKKITDTAYDYGQPAWSPDGKFLVYYGKIHPMQLFINSAGGGNQKELSTPGLDAYQPSWGRQNKIAFNSRPLGQTPNEISVINSDGTGLTKLTDTVYDYAAPRWSPDGRKIALVRSVAIRKQWKDITPEERKLMQTAREIMVMNDDGSARHNLTNDSIKESGPLWSRDGKTIYFLTEIDSVQFVSNVTLNGDKPKMLFKLSDPVFTIDVSPDEKYIVYAANRENKPAIYIWDLNKKSERKLIGN